MERLREEGADAVVRAVAVPVREVPRGAQRRRQPEPVPHLHVVPTCREERRALQAPCAAAGNEHSEQ